MSEIKLTIDGTEYEFENYNSIYTEIVNSPVLQLGGIKYVGKAIPKQPSNDWEIISFKLHDGTIFYKKESGLYGLLGGGIVPEKEMIEKGHEIYEVRRISDGEVFKVDEKFTANAGCELTIKSFEISNNLLRVCSKEYGYWLLSKIQKVKPKLPLFKDSLGNDVFQYDRYYMVTANFSLVPMEAILPHVNSFDYNSRIFKDYSSANAYIEEHKPIDVIELYQHDIFERGVDVKKYCYVLTLSKPLTGSNGELKTKIKNALNQK